MLSSISIKKLTTRFIVPAIGLSASIGYYHTLNNMAPISNDSPVTFVGGDDWIDLKVKKIVDVTHDTYKVFFELPSPEHVSGLVTASALLAKYVTPKGSNVIRPYTPISEIGEKGELEFVIKRYEGGKMSNHIKELKPEDTLSFKGPIVKWKWQPNQFKEIILLGGGTGITPLYQLVREIAQNPEDNTKVKLFYGNKTPKDVLLHDELSSLASKYPKQVSIVQFVDTPDETWKESVGYISADFLKANLPQPSEDVHIFVCGPPGLYNALSGPKVSPTDQGELTGALKELGFNKNQVFKF
ncbi:unnamed protein product [Kuraishia capsulata CBS 1993]|uniref:NADH-cytochrome b5 reductase n=1 Tax=Kuraishia capsulata CBS 1993 TaxID=1382522 RepID=W6MTJ2_9ASCO|nr:uncharacterized protein KUCA_T00006049001 [Kuraishia capsulata CBS 1993]CDK30054.1 unnamed protein product [Kuraishia capsulata CBS 1993]